jgi:peroxiredoxin
LNLKNNAMKKFLFILLISPALLFGAKAPDFTITDYNNKVHKLYADYLDKNKVVVLKLFFVDCPPCNAAAPAFQQANLKWGNGANRVQFLELSTQTWDNNADVKGYSAKHSITFPGAASDGGALEATAPYKNSQFGTYYGTPTYIVISPNGEVNYNVRFYSNEPVPLDSAITQALRVTVGGTGGGGDTRCKDSFGVKITSKLKPDHVYFRDILYSGNPEYDIPSGQYNCEFYFPPIRDGYYVIPEKNQIGNIFDGVSTADIVLIQKHILGQKKLNDLQFALADVNKTLSVTASDIIEIRKLILGVTNKFAKVNAIYTVQNNPSAYTGIISNRAKINDILSNKSSNEFGVGHYGDITAASSFADEFIDSRSSCAVDFSIRITKSSTGYKYVLYPTEDIKGVLAFQFGLKENFAAISNINLKNIPGFSPSNFYVNSDKNELRLIWDDPSALGEHFISKEGLISFNSPRLLNPKESENIQSEITFIDGGSIEACDIRFHIINDAVTKKTKIKLIPSPESVLLTSDDVIEEISVVNHQGTFLINLKPNDNSVEIPTKHLLNGVYFIIAISADGENEILKFIKI